MIEVGRSSIVVRNIKKDSKELKIATSRFSVWDPVTHKYTLSAFFELGSDLYFPASIGIEPITACFPDKKVEMNLKNMARSKPISFNIVHPPRNDLQEKAIKFLLDMKKDENCKERFLSLATGSGKTYITINIASKFRKRTLIVVDTLDLADQWKREFIKHSDLTEDSIGIISGKESVEKFLKEDKKSIYIAIHRTLANMISEDPNSINNLMRKLGIGLRVFDESHENFKNICNINSYNIYQRI